MPSPTDDWRAALDHVARARVTVVVGASDAGKTTLVATLAGELASRGVTVGVVDADLGQSEIGPPTTVGLGRVVGRLGRLSEATLVALHFVGVSSPALDLRETVEGARRMTARARLEGFEHVLVDTSGLVTGRLGVALKRRKLDALDPDLVLVLAREGECDEIVEPYGDAERPRIVKLPARGRLRSRSQAARRAHRVAALDRYLAGAPIVSLDLSGVTVETAGVQLGACAGVVCGIDGPRGETLALGVVQDVLTGVLDVRAPLASAAGVMRVRIGRERADGTPLAPDGEGMPPGRGLR